MRFEIVLRVGGIAFVEVQRLRDDEAFIDRHRRCLTPGSGGLFNLAPPALVVRPFSLLGVTQRVVKKGSEDEEGNRWKRRWC